MCSLHRPLIKQKALTLSKSLKRMCIFLNRLQLYAHNFPFSSALKVVPVCYLTSPAYELILLRVGMSVWFYVYPSTTARYTIVPFHDGKRSVSFLNHCDIEQFYDSYLSCKYYLKVFRKHIEAEKTPLSFLKSSSNSHRSSFQMQLS